MPRPKYKSVATEKGSDLYSPSGEKIVNCLTTYGSEHPRCFGLGGLSIPEHMQGQPQDKVFEWAMNAHERMVTTKWQRIRWTAEEVFANPIWQFVTAVAVVVTAVVAVMNT